MTKFYKNYLPQIDIIIKLLVFYYEYKIHTKML